MGQKLKECRASAQSPKGCMGLYNLSYSISHRYEYIPVFARKWGSCMHLDDVQSKLTGKVDREEDS